MGKKIRVSYFFMKNPYMKFQNPSMHGSEVMQCTKKCNGRTHGRTDGRTHARTNVPEAICPSNFFEVGGIIRHKQEAHRPQFAHLSKSAIAHLQVPSNILLVLPEQLGQTFDCAVKVKGHPMIII